MSSLISHKIRFFKNTTHYTSVLKLLKHDLKCIRSYTQEAKKIQGNEKKFVPFMDMLEYRKSQASRSILVQVQSAQSFKELHAYCGNFGVVHNMFHYSVGIEPQHFIMVEFQTKEEAEHILSASSHILTNHTMPTSSQFLWFKAAGKKMAKLKQSNNEMLVAQNATQIVSDMELQAVLQKCQSISEQMEKLHELTKLNDLGVRLRFLTAKQMEQMLVGLFPNTYAYPFGSSVNGFGKMGCDLDLVLRLTTEKEKGDSRLVFHCKASASSERSMNQRNMETIGDIIHLFLPGCSQVRRILQARVPIIKYHQVLTDIECDLSMTNMSGVYMSDFLYIMGEIDGRVRPLVFAIRKWAKEMGITYSSPGRWITNFSLTLLVLAFLQNPLNSPPVLPPLNLLVKTAGSTDKYVTEDGIDCSFARDIIRLPFKSNNTESLESLLKEFFEFYAQFNFNNKAICLNEPVALNKPEHNAMYIVNPLERGLNVSKNMSIEEVERFKIDVKTAAWTLDSQDNRRTGNWGLLSILENRSKVNQLMTLGSQKHNRLMDITTLFEEAEEISAIEEKKIQFKNDIVENQVDHIKRETTTLTKLSRPNYRFRMRKSSKR